MTTNSYSGLSVVFLFSLVSLYLPNRLWPADPFDGDGTIKDVIRASHHASGWQSILKAVLHNGHSNSLPIS
jgi:hypothetical protein